MKYSPQDLAQGEQFQREAADNPSTFATADGVTQQVNNPKAGKMRMAGEKMNRQAQLVTNPEEQMRTSDWMNRFGLSNGGFQFNQARMMVANPQPQQEQQ